jgi:hypothetical protein
VDGAAYIHGSKTGMLPLLRDHIAVAPYPFPSKIIAGIEAGNQNNGQNDNSFHIIWFWCDKNNPFFQVYSFL